MGFLSDMYGKRSPDFVDGFLAAMDCYAIWKDGKQYIGMDRELKAEMKSAVGELAENPKDFDKKISFFTN